MKKVAIMGNGFVGTNIYNYLKSKNYDVTMASINDFSFLNENDTCNFIKNGNYDVVIHCANYGGSRLTGYDENNNQEVVDTNLAMFKNITKEMREDAVLIHFGSGAQYNKARDLVNINEDKIGEVLPVDGYGLSKIYLSKEMKKRPNSHNLIIFGLYGQGEDYRYKFISNAIVKNLLHQPIVINQNVRFSYLFLDDMMKLIELSCSKGLKNSEFNVTPDESITLIEAANIINEISDYKSPIYIKNDGMNYEYTGDNSRLKENFPDFQFTSYRDGIKKLYAYYKKILPTIDAKEIIDDNFIAFCKTRR